MKYWDKENSFVEFMDPKTGYYVRSGVLNRNELTGKMVDSGVDPFMRNYPGLIDVGIMGSCQNASLGLCKAGGIDCYQSGSAINQPNISLANFEKICTEAEGKVFQIALGGRGDPNHHEHFGGILGTARKYGIVPNYTTSGINLTDKQVALSKLYCGAVAVSYQRGEHTWKAIDMFLSAEMKTNIHYVLSKTTIDEATTILENKPFNESMEKINAIIFLLHKPVGNGTVEKMLTLEEDEYKINRFINAVNKHRGPNKIGFDSCSIPLLVNQSQEHVDMTSCDTCEAARFSMYITPDMQAIPCSFDQDKKWAVDLNKFTIEQAWNSSEFNSFRNRFKTACPNCKDRTMCLGGCPIKNQIVLCNRTERT